MTDLLLSRRALAAWAVAALCSFLLVSCETVEMSIRRTIDNGQFLVQAIDAFYESNKRVPQSEAEFKPFIKEDISISTSQDGALYIYGWRYSYDKQNDKACSMSKKVSIDAFVYYKYEAGAGEWFYDPGDGGPEEKVSEKLRSN